MIVNATLRKSTIKPLKNFVIPCIVSGASGTEIGHNSQTAFERIEPVQTRNLCRINFGVINQQASAAVCEIENSPPA